MKLSDKKIIEYIALTVAFLSATVIYYRNKETKEQIFESYIFIDEIHVLHTSPECEGIKPANSAEPIPLKKLSISSLSKICSRCVNEKQLDELERIVE